MSKIIFYLKPNRPSGINFNTRYGASITLLPGQRLEYLLRDEDELTPEEQVQYYNERYAHRGLVTSIAEEIVIPVKKPFDRLDEDKSTESSPAPVSVKEPTNIEDFTDSNEEEVSSEITDNIENEANSIENEESSAENEEPSTTDDLDSLSYSQLRAKAEELGITLEGRESKVSIKEKILAAGN